MGEEPEQGVLEEMVLGRGGKDFVAVAHVDVEHVVARVGPHHRAIAGSDRVFQADRVIAGIEGKEHFYILIHAWRWLPDVPLVGWGGEDRRQALRYRVLGVVYL